LQFFFPKTMLRFIVPAFVALGALAPFAAEAASSCGYASHYGRGDGFAWRTMANGQPMNPNALTTASRDLPMGTKILVTNPANGKSVRVTVTDRGPALRDRLLDLSYGAFAHVAKTSQGVARLCFSLA
jgi:rare lipoprotein A